MARSVSRREKRFLVAGAGALVLFLGARLVLSGAVNLPRRVSTLIPEKLAVLGAYQEAVGREAALEAEDRGFGIQLETYERQLLPSATPPLAAADLQTRLKDLADKAGLKIQSEKILTHVKKGAYLEIPVQLIATGNIRNLRDFILSVEKSPVHISIQAASLRAAPRRTFVPESRTYVEILDIQATMTLVGVIPG